ncbi:MAG TPA: DCC1-like thiol-disulfide oxidoreductase family protein [Candidatus Sulfotelmatobacter sp.]|nr:DCC1-like thiol-disulfide oxidoreductase family protein [Candidatus Sulfotelmatobacter sp.]
MQAPILLYDGVCGLCNRFVQFILRRDRNAIFRFATLQSPLAARILARHGAIATDLETVYVAVNFDPSGPDGETPPDELLLGRSDAVHFVLLNLSTFWRVMARLLGILPRSLRDWGYGVIARNRYSIFGRYDTCPIPDAATRNRFLDL